jgi:hypothetical protein
VSHSLENTVFFFDDVMFKYILSSVILFCSILPVFMEHWKEYIVYLDVRFFHLIFIIPNYNLSCRKYRVLKRKTSYGECMLISKL